MKTIGIIAEYNPFHTGHEYHILKTKELTGADRVVVIMSGNFVQRGTPAICDKYTRATAAILGGADLVLELPAYYSCGSAEFFAMGAVSILNQLQIIDYLSFGTESDNIESLNQIADILVNEPDEYKSLLMNELNSGNNMAVARSNALLAYTGNSLFHDLVNSPNNILALEYLKALKNFCSPISPVNILREGAGYHDKSFDMKHTSATALRECFNNKDFRLIRNFTPDRIFNLYENNHNLTLPILPEDIDNLLYYAIISAKNSLTDYLDISTNLEGKIINYIKSGNLLKFDDLILSLKSKEFTYTRISRALLHILLDIRTSHYNAIKASNYPGFARILAFNTAGREIIGEIKSKSTLPVITNLSDNINQLSDINKMIIEKDIYASNVYRCIVNTKYHHMLKDEFRTHPVIIQD